MKIEIYPRDLVLELRNDEFMGEGFEKAVKKAEENDEDLIVGYFDDSWKEEK